MALLGSRKLTMIILVFLLQFSILSATIAAADCPDCGKTKVPFPLSTDPSCGRPEYGLKCDGTKGQLQLQALSGLYPVRSIDVSASRLVISQTPFRNSSCTTLDATFGGLLLNRSQAFNVTSSNTIMLLNCSSPLLRSPLNCSQSSTCHRYSDQVPEGRICKSSSNLCCTFTAGGSSTSYRIGATTNGSACSAYVSVVHLDPASNPVSWGYGVELGWQPAREALCSPNVTSCDNKSACSLEVTSNSYRCLCLSGYVWNATRGVCNEEATEKAHTARNIVAGLVSATVAICLALLAAFFLFRRRTLSRQSEAAAAREMRNMMTGSTNIYNAKDMKRATHDFSKSNLLGSGGFGEVYKGTLDDGTVVAIKAAKLGNVKGRDQVINEVCILSQVNHRNLVRLWGCCVDTTDPLLVYEYIPNGTLQNWLQGQRGCFLPWKTRLKIALQTAEGLAYLHSAAVPPIYHRDVKSSNILLDEFMDARVCDFGLSRLAETDLSHVSTCAQGTLGYLDPEYYRNYQLTDKSDVYSFGVVLLEIVTSQKAIDFSREQDDVNLAMYVRDRVQKDLAMEVVDQQLLVDSSSSSNFSKHDNDDEVLRQSVLAVIMLALSCLQESRKQRPTMKEVAEQLGYFLSTVS